MEKLQPDELHQALRSAPGWVLAGGKLQREWKFPDFLAAIYFVQKVALIADEAGHHPDIDIRYNCVVLGLTTHDAGGITANDASMAVRLNRELPG